METCAMPRKTAPDLFAELRKIDTPTITNVVATYPTNPICLGLYNPWSENWYTDTSVRCMYPEIGPVAGYAVTCVYSVPDPNYNRLTFMDVVDALDASPKPTILVLQQKFPPELITKAGLAGEIMITSMQAVGCVGLISNGPSRDIDAIRALKLDRKSTRLNSSHSQISYAVFCLKKKKKNYRSDLNNTRLNSSHSQISYAPVSLNTKRCVHMLTSRSQSTRHRHITTVRASYTPI